MTTDTLNKLNEYICGVVRCSQCTNSFDSKCSISLGFLLLQPSFLTLFFYFLLLGGSLLVEHKNCA